VRFLVPLLVVLAACAAPPPAVVGWQDPDAHLVDSRWIGAETSCAASFDPVACRILVGKAVLAVPSNLRVDTSKAVLASLPRSFRTANGEMVGVDAGWGITALSAVVFDVADGSRRVIGLACYLPYRDGGRLVEENVTCNVDALDSWSDRHDPTWAPPGKRFAGQP
jgi:hypothetical protein